MVIDLNDRKILKKIQKRQAKEYRRNEMARLELLILEHEQGVKDLRAEIRRLYNMEHTTP